MYSSKHRIPDERNKIKLMHKSLHRGENRRCSFETTSGTSNEDRLSYNYDISYSTTTTNRDDLVSTSFSYIENEKDDFFEQRLDIIHVLITNNNDNNTYIDMNKVLVYVSLEFLLNINPDPILLKNIYDHLDKYNKSIINGYHLWNYFKQNKNELIEYIHLNDMDRDSQISHCCQWKLTQIFSMYKLNETMKIKYGEIKSQNDKLKQKLQLKQNEINKLKQDVNIQNIQKIKKVPISRTNIEKQSTSKDRVVPIHRNKAKHKNKKKKTAKHNISKHDINNDTVSTWKQYTDRLMYIKQRYPTEYIDRNKAWQRWSKLLNKIEQSGKIDNSSINAIWPYIDFARMSIGKYSNWLWCPVNPEYHQYIQHNIEWTKKYVVLMDFNLFLFDKKIEPRSIKQILSYKHSILSIASIQNIIPCNSCNFTLKLNKNNSIEFRCNDKETREHWMNEIIYQLKCIQDLLKIPNIKLKSADPDQTIWLPVPIGYTM